MRPHITTSTGAEHDRIQAYRVNALGPRNLALATASRRNTACSRLYRLCVQRCSDQPYHEYDQPQPLSAYAASKLAGEEAVKELNQRHFIVRTAWLFHPSGKNFLNTMLSLSRRPQLKVVKDKAQFAHLCATFGRGDLDVDRNPSLWHLSLGGPGRNIEVRTNQAFLLDDGFEDRSAPGAAYRVSGHRCAALIFGSDHDSGTSNHPAALARWRRRVGQNAGLNAPALNIAAQTL